MKHREMLREGRGVVVTCETSVRWRNRYMDVGPGDTGVLVIRGEREALVKFDSGFFGRIPLDMLRAEESGERAMEA